MQLDDFDRKILNHLQDDASSPIEAIAARVGLSRNACWRRIKALEAAKVLTRRIALVDPQAVVDLMAALERVFRIGRSPAVLSVLLPWALLSAIPLALSLVFM